MKQNIHELFKMGHGPRCCHHRPRPAVAQRVALQAAASDTTIPHVLQRSETGMAAEAGGNRLGSGLSKATIAQPAKVKMDTR